MKLVAAFAELALHVRQRAHRKIQRAISGAIIAGATITVAGALMMFTTVAQVVAQTAPVIVVVPTPAPNHPILTAPELVKIDATMVTYGKDIPLTVEASRMLGLSASSRCRCANSQ